MIENEETLRRTEVTVCIPVYNGDLYLRECIESVLAQTFRNFELLIVDDCSTDTSSEIVARYEAADQRVRYVRNHNNLGLVGNWNRCVALAKNEWIKFVFQDDLIDPTCLSEMMELATYPAMLISCRREFIFDTSVDQKRRNFYLSNQGLISRVFSDASIFSPIDCRRIALEHVGSNLFGEPTCVLLNKTFFERFGLFRNGLIMSCDLEYWIRVSIHVGARYIDKPLARFRVHAAATSAHNFSDRAFRMNVLDNLLLLHDFAYLPVYTPLREYGIERRPTIDLKKIFHERLHDTYAKAEWAQKDALGPDAQLMHELDALSTQFPQIVVGRFAHIVWRLRLRLSKVLEKAHLVIRRSLQWIYPSPRV